MKYLQSLPVALALTLGVSFTQCSYDVVFSRTITESRTGAAGQAGAGQANTNSSSGGGTGAPPTPAVPAGISWQWQLTGVFDMSALVDVFVVDLTETADEALSFLRSRGRRIICSFSAGSSETWRSDVAALPPDVLGNALSGRSDEFWLDIRSASVRSVMTQRLELAQARGCDAVLPDSIDGYGADTGLLITEVDALDYLAYLSQEAHSRGLAIGLSNAPELVAAAEPWFDFEIEVGCLEYNECDRYRPFLSENKAVLHVEVVSDATSGALRFDSICSDSRRAGFSTILKMSQLDAWKMACE